MRPAVSAVMPVRDGARYVRAAIDSLRTQTLGQIEIIVVDDGSRDGTAQILDAIARRDPRLRVLQQTRRGLVAALNDGLAAARSELVARMDADDLSLPGRLAAQRELLRSDEQLVACGCLVDPLGPRADAAETGVSAGWLVYLDWLNSCVTSQQIERELFVESPLAHPSVMMRRDALLDAGGYRDFDGPEDYDLWLRLAARGGRLAKVDATLLRWRDTPSRLTRTDRRYRTDAFARLKAEHLPARLDRLGAAGRPLIVWGAGRYGRLLSRALIARSVAIAAFIDIDPRKLGRTRRGRPVLDVDAALSRHPDAFVLGAVPLVPARERIRAALRRRGRRELQDFLLCA